MAKPPELSGAVFSTSPREQAVGEEAVLRDSRRWVLRIAVGIVAWAVFLLLPGLFNPRIINSGWDDIVRDLIGNPRRVANALFYLAVFYGNYFFFLPRLYLRRRYGAYTLAAICCFGLFVCLNAAMQNHVGPLEGLPDRDALPDAASQRPSTIRAARQSLVYLIGPSHNLFLFLMACGASFTLRLYKQWRLVAEEKAVAEIAFLKAQMAPHFLFNTLNSIYSLALSKSDEAPEAVLKLSRLLRYNVSEARGARVSLHKELDYIRAYMDLQRLRFSEKVSLWCEITGEEEGLEIEPFLLIPFIENAFKHGVNSEENSDIQVFIRIRNTELHMGVSNRKVTVQRRDEDSTGVGIENTKQRLGLLYPGRHDIEIDDSPVYFTVNLEIQLL